VTILKMILREIGWVGMDWIDLPQDRGQWIALVNMVMKYSGTIKCWEIVEKLSDWWLLKKGSAPWS
jgi:hypothetical protein